MHKPRYKSAEHFVLIKSRFIITFLSSMVAATCAATYGSITKRLRLPTVLAYISFIIFNGASNTGYLHRPATNIVSSSYGHCDFGKPHNALGVSDLPRYRARSLPYLCGDRCAAKCSTRAYVGLAINRFVTVFLTISRSISSGLLLSTRSLGGSTALAICE